MPEAAMRASTRAASLETADQSGAAAKAASPAAPTAWGRSRCRRRGVGGGGRGGGGADGAVGGCDGGGGGTGGVPKLRRLNWIFGSSPGGACRTENRQRDADEEIAFEASASAFLEDRKDAQRRARSKRDRHLARLPSQPCLKVFLVIYLDQQPLPSKPSPRSTWPLAQDSARDHRLFRQTRAFDAASRGLASRTARGFMNAVSPRAKKPAGPHGGASTIS
jgi:hypothetical protein